MMITKRGKVLRAAGNGPGLLTAGGRQYAFVQESMWQSEVSPQPGMTVDTDFDAEDTSCAIRAISDDLLVREQAAAGLEQARDKGSRLFAGAVARFGRGHLIAEAVLLLGWFGFAFLTLRLPYGGAVQSRTFWQLLGYLGSANPLLELGNPAGGGSGSGLYGLLGMAALAGPFLPFVWKARRAVLGGLLPLASMAGVCAMAAFEVQQAMPPASNRYAYEAAQEGLKAASKALSLMLELTSPWAQASTSPGSAFGDSCCKAPRRCSSRTPPPRPALVQSVRAPFRAGLPSRPRAP